MKSIRNRKILFIVPANEFYDIQYKKNYIIPKSVPYGVLSIASYLQEYSKNCIDVKILDLSSNYMESKEIKESIKQCLKEFKPDLVGVSVLTSLLYPYIKKYFDIVKEFDKDIFTFIGGIVATNLYKQLLDEFENIDAACYAEGEIPILELSEAENINELVDNHVSWITRNSIKAGKIPQLTFVEDLDQLPFIDFSLIDLSKYGARGWQVNADLKKGEDRVLPIHTTRGCPFNCVFCCAAKTHGKKIRQMSAKRVIEHVKNMIDNYGMDILSIDDDQFLATKERSKEILRELAPFKLRLEAESGLSVRFIDDDMARLLKEAGLKSANLAIESGSKYVLKEIIDKPLTLDEIRSAVKNLRKYDFTVKAYLVLGLPGETDEHRRETVDFVNEVGFDMSSIFTATPFHGSRLYDICVKNGYINKEDAITSMPSAFHSVISTPEYSAEHISEQAFYINLNLNFVNNYNMRIGKLNDAKAFFYNVATKYPEHAFAHYYLARACEKLGESGELIESHDRKFNEIIDSDKEWKKYSLLFKLI
ncbi:B12-binding domain-containing radical SAM protein [Clostridium hydrogenum]|uniref:B12-binding domain-containing radical SAM protein n=1 Tax=Clostridium hydrogenum TaxID=2855764 RepID=UPI002E36BB42|nr:radical SAM protein [Clostridium hydrogenum]